MFTAFGRLAFIIFACLFLASCAPLATVLGFSQPTIQAAVQFDQMKMVADGISFAGSGKTVSDHVISKVTGEDCKIFNVLEAAPVCADESR